MEFKINSISDHFINFDVQECKTNKFFGNKIWQSVKFRNKWTDTIMMQNEKLKQIEISELSQMDKWILSKLSHTIDIVNESLHKYEFHVTTSALKNFLYYDFCDVYLVSDFSFYFIILFTFILATNEKKKNNKKI